MTAGPWLDVLRIGLVDDHAFVRVGVRRLLEQEPELQVVAEWGDAESALADLSGARRGDVDLLVLDLSLPGRSGLDLQRDLQGLRAAAHPVPQVLVVSMHDQPLQIEACRRAGAWGFLSKSADPCLLVQAAQRLRCGLPGTFASEGSEPVRAAPHELLSLRERDVLQALLDGQSLESIAQRLGRSLKTVANCQSLIRTKLGVGSAVELLGYARRHRLLP